MVKKVQIPRRQTGIDEGWSYAYRDRKVKKRDKRSLWIVKMNAALRENGMTYSKFIPALKKRNIELDRKILSQLAEENPEIFIKILEKVKA